MKYLKKKFNVFMGGNSNYDKIFGKKRLVSRKVYIKIITYIIMILYVLFCALIITWGK